MLRLFEMVLSTVAAITVAIQTFEHLLRHFLALRYVEEQEMRQRNLASEIHKYVVKQQNETWELGTPSYASHWFTNLGKEIWYIRTVDKCCHQP